ncbi:aldo/keto reductase [Variovorax sp. YR752]|uniref:aldo/keto reductase n=1 Tax=Variovorax sp. YR752 TaxID=1884383 RepID=UPI003138141E
MKITDRRPLPRTGLALPVFGLGCAQVGGLYQAMSDAEAAALFDAAWMFGLRLFDTAPYYGYTRSERRIAVALASRPRAEFLLSTKVGRLMRPDASVRPGDDGWADPLPFRPHFDYSHDGVLRSFDDSLQRLGMASVDLIHVHDIGERTHGQRQSLHWEQLTRGGGFRALERLRHEGAVKAVGLGVNEWQIAHAGVLAFDLDCVMLAGRYTLLEQESLSPFLDDCLQRGVAVLAAGPFNSGVLAGASSFDYGPVPGSVVRRVQGLQTVCAEFDVPLPAAALQFPLAHPAVVSCVAGAHDTQQLMQNIRWFETAIPADFWRALQARGLIDGRAPLPLD